MTTKQCGFCKNSLVYGKMHIEATTPIVCFCCKNCGSVRPLNSDEKRHYFSGLWYFGDGDQTKKIPVVKTN